VADPALAVPELLAAANRAGGKDNVTAVLASAPLFGAALMPPHNERYGDSPARGTSVNPSALETRDLDRVHHPGGSTRSWRRAALYAAVLIGIVAAAGGWMWWRGVPAFLSWDSASRSFSTTAGPRILRVSPGSDTGLRSIAAALDAAQAGDIVEVDAGTYAESIVLRDGITVRARQRRGVTLERPMTVNGPWTAISATAIRSGGVSGVIVKGTTTAPLDYGVWITGGSVDLDDLEIVGARSAAIQIDGQSTARLRGSDVHDNAGPGILVDSNAVPEILHNVIERNGRQAPPRAGIELRGGARAAIAGNIVRGNGQPGIVGLPAADVDRVAASNVIEVPAAQSPLRRR
jgi:hypothetical protein